MAFPRPGGAPAVAAPVFLYKRARAKALTCNDLSFVSIRLCTGSAHARAPALPAIQGLSKPETPDTPQLQGASAAAGPWCIKADWQPFSHKWQSDLRAALPSPGKTGCSRFSQTKPSFKCENVLAQPCPESTFLALHASLAKSSDMTRHYRLVKLESTAGTICQYQQLNVKQHKGLRTFEDTAGETGWLVQGGARCIRSAQESAHALHRSISG